MGEGVGNTCLKRELRVWIRFSWEGEGPRVRDGLGHWTLFTCRSTRHQGSIHVPGVAPVLFSCPSQAEESFPVYPDTVRPRRPTSFTVYVQRYVPGLRVAACLLGSLTWTLPKTDIFFSGPWKGNRRRLKFRTRGTVN